MVNIGKIILTWVKLDESLVLEVCARNRKKADKEMPANSREVVVSNLAGHLRDVASVLARRDPLHQLQDVTNRGPFVQPKEGKIRDRKRSRCFAVKVGHCLRAGKVEHEVFWACCFEEKY